MQFFKMAQQDKLTDDDYEYMKCRYIIQNKTKFDKLTIQKAQQFIDWYLLVKEMNN